jgi:hypothetical protein
MSDASRSLSDYAAAAPVRVAILVPITSDFLMSDQVLKRETSGSERLRSKVEAKILSSWRFETLIHSHNMHTKESCEFALLRT